VLHPLYWIDCKGNDWGIDFGFLTRLYCAEKIDDRTLGDLFYYLREELADIKLSHSLMLLVDTLRQVLSQLPLLSQEMANEIMNSFLNAIPHPIKEKLLLCA
jgi:hypothetical protein